MNRTDKPKMTSKALVDKLRDEKGVSFKYVTEDNAEKYLAKINNYLRTASYRKNYQKYFFRLYYLLHIYTIYCLMNFSYLYFKIH